MGKNIFNSNSISVNTNKLINKPISTVFNGFNKPIFLIIITFTTFITLLLFASCVSASTASSTAASTASSTAASTASSTAASTAKTTDKKAQKEVQKSQETKKTKEPTTCLWKLKSRKAVMYFCASDENGNEALYPLDEKVEQAFSDSDNIVVFVNYMKHQERIASIAQKKMYLPPESELLENRISGELFEKIVEILGRYNLPMDNVQGLRLCAIADHLSFRESKNLGWHWDLGIENYFFAKANKQNKQNKCIIELFEPEGSFFFMLLDELVSNNLEEQYLRQNLLYLSDMEKTNDAYIKAFKKGDITTIEDISSKYDKDFPELIKVSKNIRMQYKTKIVQRIKEILKEKGNYFVMLDIKNFLWENNLIELLQKEGYKIEQL